MKRMLIAGVACCVWLAAVSVARAESRSAASAYFLTGFGGQGKFDPTTLELDLDPSIGFGVRFEAGVLELLSLGGLVELRWFEFDGSTDKRLVADISLWVKGRYVLTLSSLVALEIYLGVPVGFSIAEEPAEVGNLGAGFGWNLGVLGGAQVLLARAPIGFFVELGWRRHHVFYEDDFGTEVDVRANQMALDFGASFGF